MIYNLIIKLSDQRFHPAVPKKKIFAIKYPASFFTQLKDLRSSYELSLLKKIETRKLTKNCKRILKSYYRRLLHKAANLTKKEVTKILRSRQNRESIAARIADRICHIKKEELRSPGKLVAQLAKKTIPR